MLDNGRRPAVNHGDQVCRCKGSRRLFKSHPTVVVTVFTPAKRDLTLFNRQFKVTEEIWRYLGNLRNKLGFFGDSHVVLGQFVDVNFRLTSYTKAGLYTHANPVVLNQFTQILRHVSAGSQFFNYQLKRRVKTDRADEINMVGANATVVVYYLIQGVIDESCGNAAKCGAPLAPITGQARVSTLPENCRLFSGLRR